MSRFHSLHIAFAFSRLTPCALLYLSPSPKAGNGAVKHCRLQPTIQIAEVEPDEAHVEAGKQLAKEVKKLGLQLPKPADFGIPQLLGW